MSVVDLLVAIRPMNPPCSYEKKLGRSFNFTFRYIDDSVSLNDYINGDLADGIYPI